MRTALIVAAAVALAPPAFAGTVVFADSDFDPARYTTTIYANPGFDTSVATATGAGNVGTALGTFYEKTGATSPAPRFQVMYDTGVESFVYDPTTQGEITSIDISLDQLLSLVYNNAPVNLSNSVLQLRVLARQNGELYQAGSNTTAFAIANTFVSSSRVGILATNFTRFDPANPFAPRVGTGLDFAGGGATTFGFELAHYGVLVNGGPSTGFTSSDMRADNFRLTLHTLDAPTTAVPEPVTWALMIGGFGMVGATFRRRRLAA